MDRVPNYDRLFIGGLDAVDQLEGLDQAGITHIVSLLEYDHLDWEEFSKYQRLWIQIEDHPNADLLSHLSTAIAFIDDCLSRGGAVLVHCAMGQSRSAAVVCAYLMHRRRLTVEEALATLQQARAMCEPNQGFYNQLQVFYTACRVST